MHLPIPRNMHDAARQGQRQHVTILLLFFTLPLFLFISLLRFCLSTCWSISNIKKKNTHTNPETIISIRITKTRPFNLSVTKIMSCYLKLLVIAWRQAQQNFSQDGEGNSIWCSGRWGKKKIVILGK